MAFSCTSCNYVTDRAYNLRKHLSTQGHLQKISDSVDEVVIDSTSCTRATGSDTSSGALKVACEFCGLSFSRTASLTRHLNGRCGKKKISEEVFKVSIEKDKEIIDLKMENKDKEILFWKSKYEDMVNKFQIKDKENDFNQNLISTTGSLIKSSMNTFSYLLKNYADAPLLKPLKDFSALEYYNDDDKLIKNLAFHQKNQNLSEFLLEFIVKSYKKEDPSQQSVWNSDTSRLTYAVKELWNEKDNWSVDKKGIKTTKSVIEPILNHIKKIIRTYMNLHVEDIYHLDQSQHESFLENLQILNDIITKIDDKSLANSIIKLMAPHFYLNKDELGRAIELKEKL